MTDLALLSKAVCFAADKHKMTRRKGSDTPYINHPLEVVNLLISFAGVLDAKTLAAAAMHDLIEDEGVTKEELVFLFGEDVASLVCEVTDNPQLSKSEQKQAQIEKAPFLSIRAALIKLGDKTSNVRAVIDSPPPWPRSTQLKYIKHAKIVVDLLPDLPLEAEPLIKFFNECYDKGVLALARK